MTGRREFLKQVRVAAYKRADGHCEKCTAKLVVGKFAYDHIVADAIGGEPVLSNCQVLCASCHLIKTAAHDVPVAAKAKRQEAKHIGAERDKPPIRSAPFPIGKCRKENPTSLPPRRPLYQDAR